MGAFQTLMNPTRKELINHAIIMFLVNSLITNTAVLQKALTTPPAARAFLFQNTIELR